MSATPAGRTMRAMRHHGERELRSEEVPVPEPGPGELRVRVHACGVCRTDLHLVDGELQEPMSPVIPGHEIVGVVDRLGAGTRGPPPGTRVGVPWLGWTCGRCAYCTSGRENLCPQARFHGYTRDGGYAAYVVADARYVFALPAGYDDVQAAPLLCAGLIGHRAYRMAGAGRRLGLYGFGAAAHLLAQVAVAEGREVHAFTRPGDAAAQALARALGAHWAGGSDEPAVAALDAAILFAPVGALVPVALRQLARGGTVVCAGIHMSDIPAFAYRDLWGERAVRSVANLTRDDAESFLRLAARIPLRVQARAYPLAEANRALADLRAGAVQGAAVLQLPP